MNGNREYTYLAGKRMLILGMARSGIAAAELAASLGIQAVINDRKTEYESLEERKLFESFFCNGICCRTD